MKLGLLKSDARPFDVMYAAWLPEVEWRVYEIHSGHFPESLTECDGWVGTGSRDSVYDDALWIHTYAALVRALRALNAPFAGICFGHQMIAHALGGRVARSEGGWCVGVHQFTVRQHEPWMTPPLDSFGVVMSCQDQVRELPPGATLLAGNDRCQVGMFQAGSMLAIQGHPEYTAEYSGAQMLARAERIGEERVREGMKSLAQPRHSRELGAWICKFLAGR